MGEKLYYVYILASQRNGTLYVGVTSNLIRRIHEHRSSVIAGFTRDYRVKKLVWFESTNDVREALELEKRLKRWKRRWKLELIEANNPEWKDLFQEWSA
ncbi:excinuclease ABC subunit C [Candidatus Uhrbacteria bacterium CG_4_10_14_0_8_um_filter_58_22]|uniref:Excinuclease ABC subunit C n=1 Tax=Candidatus Uhrbacteria bacterium CG_4_10_14_0_8_um_filter_58_22 TaxID=1975029 RepID=A0A2M7Q981_9BACT|nr:MAG: hypothetical protein AUJ19_00900 [Parcubacteria group bacterium CG1_02_58_44]PIY62149.1 MAG: excinuclease ABC subunit C [Candidatus Uhrbacteria bacterium CG_4_10_14_0_8_um_filter_58_22]